jgi:4-amino-4-deoxy-L-arabinose transferase-like glycosyltransferase
MQPVVSPTIKIPPHILWLLGIGLLATAIRIWMGTSDAFLHEWDERYHALVAKNLLLHPLQPTLYDTPLLPYDHREWAFNHIWLSKPPLPLWMMAIGLKLFGIHEWAVRVPSLLFSLASILLTYHIASAMFDRKTALWAAFFHAIHGLSLEVTAGRFSSDHVDTIFLFWMELGYWMLWRYFRSEKATTARKNALALGVVTGVAFMCKWTAALLLPATWCVMFVFFRKKDLKNIVLDGSLALLAFLAIASPWVLYIVNQYPREAMDMLQGVVSPVRATVQGHTGAWYFYLHNIRIVFGEIIYLPLLWLAWEIFRKDSPSKVPPGYLFTALWMAVPLILLSAAATKRVNYLLPTAPAFFFTTALFLRLVWRLKPVGKATAALRYLVCFLLVALPVRYAVERSKVFFNRDTHPLWAQQLKALAAEGDQSHTVIVDEPHAIEAMFYTGAVAYNRMPDATTIQQWQQAGWRVLKNDNGCYVAY